MSEIKLKQIPKSIERYEIQRVIRSTDQCYRFGCGRVTVDLYSVSLFNRLQRILKSRYSGPWNGKRKYYLEATEFLSNLFRNKRFNNRWKDWRTTRTKQGGVKFGCGAVAFTYDEIRLLFDLMSSIDRYVFERCSSYNEFEKRFKQIIELANRIEYNLTLLRNQTK